MRQTFIIGIGGAAGPGVATAGGIFARIFSLQVAVPIRWVFRNRHYDADKKPVLLFYRLLRKHQ